ncbi:MAG: hypothetical protein ISR02_06475 [Flavobacteriales bacterium]|nr:hypothetical protein [Flavobacteriales bacterium]
MNKDLKKLIINCGIFSIPMVMWILTLFVVDPFNYFSDNKVIDVQTKLQSARKLNSLLYNTIAFKNNPTPNIIIGDSRIKRLPIKEIKNITGDEYFILHSNAAKLNEIIDLFWLCNDFTKLENVLLGVNFNLYNEYAYANRVQEVKEINTNPLLYIFNGSVLEITSKIIFNHITDLGFPNISRNIMLKKAMDGKSTLDKQAWWNFNISTVAKNQYSKYKYPKELKDRLEEVYIYCLKNNIKLTLLNVPHHKDYRKRIIDFQLEEEEAIFKNDIKKIGNVIDYDYENSITECKKCFTDPVHTNDSINLIMVKEIFRDSLVIGKKL